MKRFARLSPQARARKKQQSARYQRPFDLKLVAYYRLNEPDGDTAYDSSGNDYHAIPRKHRER